MSPPFFKLLLARYNNKLDGGYDSVDCFVYANT